LFLLFVDALSKKEGSGLKESEINFMYPDYWSVGYYRLMNGFGL